MRLLLLFCLLDACGGGTSDAGLDAGADAGRDAAMIDGAQDAATAVTTAEVCSEVNALSAQFGCAVPCPTTWTATDCTGPHSDWCLRDLQMQVDSCANLHVLIDPGGECDIACRP